MGGCYALPVKFPAQYNLTFGNISGQVGNGMGLVVLGHGQYRYLRDGALLALYPSGPLVNGSKVGIHVTRIAPAARHFFTGGRNFPQGFGVVGNIGK